MPNPQIERSQLPRELIQKRSDLAVLVTLAGDAADKHSFDYQALVNNTRRLCHTACAQYKPCTHSPNCVLCRSGQNGLPAFRGEACKPCTLFDPS